MKKPVLFTFVAIFVVALLLGFAWQANAQATRIEGIELYEYDCGDPLTFNPTFSPPGDPADPEYAPSVMHIRDYVHVNVVASDSDYAEYVRGINTTIANAEINFWSGTTSIRGTSTLVPHAFPDSAWVGRWVFIASNGTYFGRAVYRGTGELKGMTMFLDLYDWDGNPAEWPGDGASASDVCMTVDHGGNPVFPEESHTFGEATIVMPARTK